MTVFFHLNTGYITYVVLFVFGYLRELIWGTGPLLDNVRSTTYKRNHSGYTPLYAGFEGFYSRNVYRRLKDVFNHPISLAPGALVSLINRHSDDHFWTWRLDNTIHHNCINLASYNYLGFAENSGASTDAVVAKIVDLGLTSSSCRQELGTMAIHKVLEQTTAEYLGVEDALTVGMGFATNSLTLPALMCKGCLVLSDEKNHASIVLGLRLSGATVVIFQHNNVEHLEHLLKKAVLHHGETTRWNKIFIVVEGIYSMEGSIVRLPEIIALKKKYKAYLYLDEAHSIGAIGNNGRGVTDHFGLDPRDVDVMMGTFTKSFASAGGYIAGSHNLISFLRAKSAAFVYPASMSAPVAQKVISSMQDIIQGDGVNRVHQLTQNVHYFRRRIQQMGCVVLGDADSPLVPVMLFRLAKISFFVRGLLDRGVASVGVGFPAVDMAKERMRFCISAGHTRDMLDRALDAVQEVADLTHIRYIKCQHADIIY